MSMRLDTGGSCQEMRLDKNFEKFSAIRNQSLLYIDSRHFEMSAQGALCGQYGINLSGDIAYGASLTTVSDVRSAGLLRSP
jgi:hypothetical protein